MLQSLNTVTNTAQAYSRRTPDRSDTQSQPRDTFVPSNGSEQRADLLFKQASRNQRVEQVQTSGLEDLTSTFPGREGYDKSFLGRELSLPTVAPEVRSQVATLIGNPNESELKYTNFSIVMNGERGQPFFTAVNIDGAQVVDVPRDGSWTIDGRIRRDQQLGNEAYRNNNIDKGHQVRRRDPAWGANAHQASNDTFAYTNASLQHSQLNQKEWLQLENHVLEQSKAKGMKLTVLTGPVMRDSDPSFNNKGAMSKATKMPQEFWKMVVWNDPKEGLKGSAFVLSQADLVGGRNLFKSDDFESGRFETYQVPIEKLQEMTRLDFGAVSNSLTEAHLIQTPSDARVL